jgi:hypothetical protein
MLKKDIDYLIEEVVADCYFAIYFHPEKKDKVLEVMQGAVDLRNELFDRANSPAEKNNKSLVKKHYAQIRRDMFSGVDALFEKLSSANK